MSAILTQSTAGSLTVYIESSVGVPATGLTNTDLTADLRKQGEGSFTPFALTALNFAEYDNGFYSVALEDTDTDVLGNLELRLKGATTLWSLTTAYVSNIVAIPPVTTTAPSTSTIFGFVYSPTGDPVSGASVGANVVAPPVILGSADPVGITFASVTAKTSSSGYFSIVLVEGATVDIFIPSINYRRTLTVPSGNTNLFTIP